MALIHKKRKYFPKKTIKPPGLKRGDVIGLVTPASPITEKQLNDTIEKMVSLGFDVFYTKNVFAKKGYLAGDDALRIADLHTMFSDRSIKGIFCIRGGYGSGRILHRLDYHLIRKNPKPLIGYSDITALHQAIFKNTGMICFHGPAGTTDFTDYTVDCLQRVLVRPAKTTKLECVKQNNLVGQGNEKPYCIRRGTAKGKLVGGNLSILSALTGTYYELNMKNCIVFIEEIGEDPYRIDRMLTQLLQSGNLSRANGIVLGVFKNCETHKNYDIRTQLPQLKSVLYDRLYQLGIPVMYGFSFGHISNTCTLPIGIKAKLDAENFRLTLLEKAIKTT